MWLCRVTMLATYASAVLALLLLWNVYPKDFDYGAAAGNGLLFYNANVSCLRPHLAQNIKMQICDCLFILHVGTNLSRIQHTWNRRVSLWRCDSSS